MPDHLVINGFGRVETLAFRVVSANPDESMTRSSPFDNMVNNFKHDGAHGRFIGKFVTFLSAGQGVHDR